MAGYESVISRGGKVGEKEVLNLIEMLMNQLLKLDGIIADGDVKLQRKMQVIPFNFICSPLFCFSEFWGRFRFGGC